MTLVVRQATEKDLPRLLPMMVDFNRLEAIPWTFERGETALRNLLGSAELGFVGLAEVDEGTCGYFILTFGYDLEWNGRDAFLTEFYLVPDARGRGLGRALLAAAEDTAVSRGTRALHLMVRSENGTALALYTSRGFREPARRLLTKPLGGEGG
jgi:ribosomal protein S18 acetylase RimI-like enzyme